MTDLIIKRAINISHDGISSVSTLPGQAVSVSDALAAALIRDGYAVKAPPSEPDAATAPVYGDIAPGDEIEAKVDGPAETKPLKHRIKKG